MKELRNKIIDTVIESITVDHNKKMIKDGAIIILETLLHSPEAEKGYLTVDQLKEVMDDLLKD